MDPSIAWIFPKSDENMYSPVFGPDIFSILILYIRLMCIGVQEYCRPVLLAMKVALG